MIYANFLQNSPLIEEAGKLGLQGPHAYAITGVKEVHSDSVKQTIPLIRLRNPYGDDQEWKGDWADG